MITAKATASPKNTLQQEVIHKVLRNGLNGLFSGQRVLVLIPDHTRTLPLPMLFRTMVDILRDSRKLDFMVALGTHPPLKGENLRRLVGLNSVERDTIYKEIGLLNHTWDDPSALETIGVITREKVKEISGENWHPSLDRDVPIRIIKKALTCDHIIILGPTYPHEVAGFSGGAKYLYPGISGPELIHTTHWLGALVGIPGTIGIKDTPVRAMIHAAAKFIALPITLVALVADGYDLAGIFIGDYLDTWNAAADLSSKKHINWVDKPYQRVLSCAPSMYDELWTAGKAMYKLEPAIAKGGELIIYAPHLEVVSFMHGANIYKIGYHILPYFLGDWNSYKDIPLSVLAHSTHVRGTGTMENGLEVPNVRVTLASKISPQDCERLNLGYQDPESIKPEQFMNQEEKGVLYVPKAGEILYRLKTNKPNNRNLGGEI
jgi:nickel-dependent lactate racemase